MARHIIFDNKKNNNLSWCVDLLENLTKKTAQLSLLLSTRDLIFLKLYSIICVFTVHYISLNFHETICSYRNRDMVITLLSILSYKILNEIF